MTTKRVVFAISVLIFLLNSCAKTVADTQTPSANEQWLQNLACTFPCWQNITPQETRFEEVLPLLQRQEPNLKIDFISEDEISYQFDDRISVSISKGSSDTVDHVALSVSYQQLDVNTIAQVVGDPEKISLTRELYNSDCQAHLLYPDKGAVIDIANLQNNSKSKNKMDCQVDLKPESQIYRIILVGRSLESSEFWNHSTYPKFHYMKWEGYGTYP